MAAPHGLTDTGFCRRTIARDPWLSPGEKPRSGSVRISGKVESGSVTRFNTNVPLWVQNEGYASWTAGAAIGDNWTIRANLAGVCPGAAKTGSAGRWAVQTGRVLRPETASSCGNRREL